MISLCHASLLHKQRSHAVVLPKSYGLWKIHRDHGSMWQQISSQISWVEGEWSLFYLHDRVTEPSSVNPAESLSFCDVVNQQAAKLDHLRAEMATQCQMIQEHSTAQAELGGLWHEITSICSNHSALSVRLQLSLSTPKYDVLLMSLDMIFEPSTQILTPPTHTWNSLTNSISHSPIQTAKLRLMLACIT